jgi:hypothetical protein
MSVSRMNSSLRSRVSEVPFDVYSPAGELVLSYGAPLPTPAPQPVSLPELATIDCPSCQGEGCEACGETGRLEVCGVCRTVPTVVRGLDACGCGVGVMA